MSIIQQLKNEGVLKLHHSYKNGHLLDSSGNSNNGYSETFIPTSDYYTRDGIKLPDVYSKVLVVDTPELRLSEMTLIFYNSGSYTQKDDYFPRLLSNKGVEVYFRNSDEIHLNGENVSATANGKKCIGIYLKDGETIDLYLEGLFEASTTGATSITTNTNELFLGNVLSNRQLLEGFSDVLIISRKLTATEQAQVYGELANTTYPTKPQAKVTKEDGSGDIDKWKTDWGISATVGDNVNGVGEQISNSPFYSNLGQFRVMMDCITCIKKDINYALDFTSGWTVSGSSAITNANTLTSTGGGGSNYSEGKIFEVGRRYRIRISGNSTLTSLRFYNNKSSSNRMANYIDGSTDFDTTFDFTSRTPYMNFYLEGSGTARIDNFIIEEYDQDTKVLECVSFYPGGELKFPDWLGDSDITAWEYDVVSAVYTERTLSLSSGLYTMAWGDKIALSGIGGNNSIIKKIL